MSVATSPPSSQFGNWTTQPALADRLHLSEGDWLGLVLSVDNPRRLLALHHRLEALYDDEGRGCRGYLATGAHRLRLRPGTGDSQAAPAQRQWLQLCLWRSRRMARRTRHRTRARRTQSSANPRQDRTLAPDAQEPHPAGELLSAWRPRGPHRSLRRALQPPAISREPEKLDPRRRLRRSRSNHLTDKRKDQA